MTPTAITFLVVAIVIVWGGLVLSILNLRRAGAEGAPDSEDDPADGPTGSTWTGPSPRDL